MILALARALALRKNQFINQADPAMYQGKMAKVGFWCLK